MLKTLRESRANIVTSGTQQASTSREQTQQERCSFAAPFLALQALRSHKAVRTLAYAAPPGGLPPQTDQMTGRAKFTDAYAVLPKVFHRARPPGWKERKELGARAAYDWFFAETFSQYVVELEPGGSGEGRTGRGRPRCAVSA